MLALSEATESAGQDSSVTPPSAPDAPSTASVPPSPPENTDDEIVVTAEGAPPPGDPLRDINQTSFAAVEAVDGLIVAPVARTYTTILPGRARQGVHNLLNNLNEPIVFVSFLLQLKPGKAVETATRFAINSTLGVAGLMDIAKQKPFNLPYRVNGLGHTMGYYGIGTGPFLVLPLIGPTTVRDVIGRVTELSIVPAAFGHPFNHPAYSLTTGTLSSIDQRVEAEERLVRIRASADPYATLREIYLTQRQAEIDALKGKKATAPVERGTKAAPAL